MIKISVIIPGIRPQNWQRIYESIRDSFSTDSFEMIAVGPNFPSDFFNDKLNFKYVRDFGHPNSLFPNFNFTKVEEAVKISYEWFEQNYPNVRL